MRRIVVAGLVAVAACGGPTDTVTTLPAPSAAPSTAPRPATTLVADVTTTAERLDTPVQIAMIGGSEVEWAGVSVAAELAALGVELAGRPTGVQPYVTIAALPEHDEAALAQAVADGADVLVITLNIAWLTWEEPHCNPPEGAPPGDQVERYVCVLTPISDEVTARRHAALERLISAVADTGLPTVMFATPHSTTSLADPRIADLIETREQQMAGFDPQLDHIVFVAESFTRGRDGFTEPEAFSDMVHPTPTGARLIAEWLAEQVVALPV